MLVIDDREKALRQELGDSCSVRRLLIADALVCADNDSSPCMAIERKTVPDLRASLVDGRFAEQRSRMVDHYTADCCAYVIEGQCEDSEMGVLMSLRFRDRIVVMQTSGVAETARVLTKLSELAEQGRLVHRPAPPAAMAKVKKASTACPKAALVAFLTTIDGVSRKIALVIGERFEGPGHLSRTCAESGAAALRDLQCGARKLGPKLAGKIVQAFMS